jgi:hypothetical protein
MTSCVHNSQSAWTHESRARGFQSPAPGGISQELSSVGFPPARPMVGQGARSLLRPLDPDRFHEPSCGVGLPSLRPRFVRRSLAVLPRAQSYRYPISVDLGSVSHPRRVSVLAAIRQRSI